MMNGKYSRRKTSLSPDDRDILQEGDQMIALAKSGALGSLIHILADSCTMEWYC